MPLSWNEIRNRAHEFSKRWEGESSERAEAQSFWNEFFSVPESFAYQEPKGVRVEIF